MNGVWNLNLSPACGVENNGPSILGSLSWLGGSWGAGLSGKDTPHGGEGKPAFQDGQIRAVAQLLWKQNRTEPRGSRSLVDSASLAAHIGLRGLKQNIHERAWQAIFFEPLAFQATDILG